MKQQVYCDNGSTSFPKAPGLGLLMGQHIDNNGYNISRGGYTGAYSVETEVIQAKEQLCNLFHHTSIREVSFTSGATVGLNMVLKGLLKPGDHVITSAMEHNAVVRPLTQLVELGVEWDRISCDIQGNLSGQDVLPLLKSNTKLILLTHGSNVCGTITPIQEVGAICAERDIYFAVDCAQTAGSEPIYMDKYHIDALIFPGHKGLLGPQGVGGLIMTSRMAENVEPLISGGTGSQSHETQMPHFLPDKFQPGTLNIPGIIGLKHSLSFIEQEGLVAIKAKKMELTALFIEKVKNLPDIRLVGREDIHNRCSVVSLDFSQIDNAEISFLLESEYGIMTRCGLHCAPHAHKILHTFPQGTVRFSFGYFTTREQISYVVDAIYKILKSYR